MKHHTNLLIYFSIVNLIFIDLCFSQGIPVKALEQGNAFLYHFTNKIPGFPNSIYDTTITVLGDTTISEKIFHKLSSGIFEFADSSRLISYRDSQLVICDFGWSVGDTVISYGQMAVVTEKGTANLFSTQLQYLKLSNGPHLINRTIFKKFGIIDDHYEFLLTNGSQTLLGARIGGVTYGSTPSSVSRLKYTEDLPQTDIYPNPSSHSINIKIKVLQSSEMKIEVFNLIGQRVSLVFQGRVDKGDNVYRWNGNNTNGRNVSSGFYFVQILSDNKIIQNRVLLLK
jgi:hypothetical protein